MKPYMHEFEVEGVGPFPLDMLRYDHCWPARESEDVATMHKMSTYEGATRLKRQRIRLKTVWEKAWQPTTARWISFGWRVVDGSHQSRSL